MANSEGPVGNLIPEDEWLAKKRPSLSSEFTKGIGRGTDTAQGSLYGAGAAVADQFGANNARNFLEDQQARNTQEAQQYGPAATDSTSQVVDAFKNEGIGAGMHRAGEFAASGLGELVPQVAASVLAYKAGGKVGGKPAAIAATTAQNIAQETGGIYDDIRQKTGQRESGTALGYGTGAGLIDTASELIPLGKIAGQGLGIGKGITGVGKDIAVAGLKQMPLEGATEVAQTAIERAAVTSIDPDQQVFTPEGRQEMIDAGAIGMLGGGAAGSAGEATGRAQQALLKKPENAPQADILPVDVPPQDNPFAAPADEYVSPIDHHVQKNVEAAAAVDPNAGVLSKVVSMGAQTGAVADAAAKQFAEDPAIQEKAVVDVFDKEVQRQALEEAKQAGLPIQKPVQTQIDLLPPDALPVEDQIARAVQAQHEATGKAPNSDQLAKAFNVTPDFAGNVRKSVLEQIAPVQGNTDVAGGKIDKQWTAFAPDSGTLNIPRDQMPQIKAEHRGAMVNFLNARGVEHEQQDVPADTLKPTQAEFSQEKVDKAKSFEGGDRSILVSSDNHVLDGHHQWLAKRENNELVKVIKLDAPIDELLQQIKEFPSAETANNAKTEERFPSIFKANQALKERGLKDTHRAWNDGKGFVLVANDQADAQATELEAARKKLEQENAQPQAEQVEPQDEPFAEPPPKRTLRTAKNSKPAPAYEPKPVSQPNPEVATETGASTETGAIASAETMTDKQLHDRISYLRGAQQVQGQSKEIDDERALLKAEIARRAAPIVGAGEVGNKPEVAAKKKLQRKPKEETKQELPTDKWRSNRVLATQEATKNGVDVSGLDLPAAVASIERKLADDAALSQPQTDYSQYSGLSVDVPAVDADTGAVGTATIHDAEAELIELEQRERSLDALLRCLSSKA